MSLAAAKLRRSNDIPREQDVPTGRQATQRLPRKSFADDKGRVSLAPLDEPNSPRVSFQAASSSNGIPPPTLANRQSESSRSDASSSERRAPASGLVAPKKTPSTNSFFKMRRTKKAAEPMFPLSHLPQKTQTPPNASSSASLNIASTPRPSTGHSGGIVRSNTERPDASQSSGPPPAAALFGPGRGSRSGNSSPTRPSFLRGRSSTMSSMGRDSNDDHLLPPATRTSSSTGRKSFGDLFGLSRLRQNSELSRQGTLTPATPGSIGSKSNSLQLTREAVALPERRDDESPAKYLVRVEEVLNRGVIAATLSKGTDAFSAQVLRSYMRSFSFFGDPMDMAIRKLLMEAELPKETQQIDRCLQAFANRYHECNPGIYSSPDQAYFIAFSLLILHTDVFNKNNKHKMQKPEYLRNTKGEGIFDEILECFYDNITYTPFIHVEDELDLGSERSISKSKRKQILGSNGDPAKRAAKEPIDPYTLIIDGNLDALRPNLKDAMQIEEHFNYLGTAPSLNLKDLQKTFFRTGVLQIVSARSRPDAFMSEKTAINPQDASQGIVDIKITKVGLLWRKDVKKRKGRSPWQEWGAILTGAQLYFFRNTSWVKNLMHQYESHVKTGNDGVPIIFKPPLEEFKPDGLKSTHGAVALHDLEYKKHKNAFIYVSQGGVDEVLLADNEEEMNDWLAKLNYAAAFRTSGVRMRGVIGSNYDGQGRRGMRRLDSSEATQLIDTPTGQVSIARGQIDHKMVEDIQTARRDFMQQKIEEGDEKAKAAQKDLDEQLRNARHLQILAPIQPRTREAMLSAAGRISAQLKWTRVDIWREKCHNDILKQDLEEEVPTALTRAIPLQTHPSQSSRDTASSPPSRLSISRNESKSRHTSSHRISQVPGEPVPQTLASQIEREENAISPTDLEFKTPPQSALGHRRSPSQEIQNTKSDNESDHTDSTSSMPTSPTRSNDQTPQAAKVDSATRASVRRSSSSSRGEDDVDADERDFLRHAGLLDGRTSKRASDKVTPATAVDEQGHAAEREKAEKNRIRRSLQRTLRESTGSFSNHRSRRGRDSIPGVSPDDTRRESMLSRGTGSFVVHGKKASVINFGTELQNMSNEEKLRPRKHSQQLEQPLSPTLSNGDEDDFYSAAGDLADRDEDLSRRESTASASTATARSFRELHRKYSSANPSRSVSNSGRLAIPSDGESEAALSFSDGRRSPLPPIETEEEEEEDEEDREVTPGSKKVRRQQQQFHKNEEDEVTEDVRSPTLGTIGSKK